MHAPFSTPTPSAPSAKLEQLYPAPLGSARTGSRAHESHRQRAFRVVNRAVAGELAGARAIEHVRRHDAAIDVVARPGELHRTAGNDLAVIGEPALDIQVAVDQQN